MRSGKFDTIKIASEANAGQWNKPYGIGEGVENAEVELSL